MAGTRPQKEFIERWQSFNGLDFEEPICNNCAHKISGGITCKAYPGGIPNEILENDVDHTKSYINDNGIVFEEKI